MQHRHALGDRIDLGAAVEDREVLVARPQLEQVAVVRAVRVAGLAGGVQPHRVVPVRGVRDDHERGPRRLVVAVAGVVHGAAVAAARQRPHVEPGPHVGADRRGHGMADEGVLELLLTVLPLRPVGAEALLQIGQGLGQAANEHRVAARDRIVAEAAVRGGQPVDDALGVQAPDELARRLGHDEVAHVGPQAALEADVDGGLDRVLVEHEVPAPQPVAQPRHLRVVDLELAQQGDDVAARDGQVVVLHAHHVDHRHVPAHVQHLLDPRRPHLVAPGVVQGLPVRVAVGHGVVVGGPVEPLVGVEHARQGGDGQVAVPLVAAVPRHRHEPAVEGPDGRHPHRLVADVAVAVGPDHVLGRDAAVAARLDELLPRAGLVHAQAREVGGAAVVEPRRAQRVGLVVPAVLVEHGAVAGVLQLDVHRVPPLHGDAVLDDRHRLPAPEVPVLVRVVGVGVVDVEVLVVLPEDGQPPRAVLVVADGHPRQHRLAAPDDVPARRHQVHPVAQRRRALHPVGVVDHEGETGQGAAARDHPVVAADGLVVLPLEVDLARQGGGEPFVGGPVAAVRLHDVVGLEPHRAPVRAVQVEDAVVQQRRVDRRIDGQVGVAVVVVQLLDRVGAQQGHRARVADLGGDVRHQPLVARDDDLGGPVAGGDAQQLELDGQQRRIGVDPVDVRVDPPHEGRDDLVPAVVIVVHLGGQVAAEPVQPRPDVALELARPENLRHRAGRLPPPHLELEQPVAGRRVALGEEEVRLVLGVDVVDAPAVGDDLHRRLQAGKLQALGLGRDAGVVTRDAQGQAEQGGHPDAGTEGHGREAPPPFGRRPTITRQGRIIIPVPPDSPAP